MQPCETIEQAVRRHAADRPADAAVVDPFRTVSWSELSATADRLAGHLATQGVGPGDRVGFLGPNSAAYPVAVLATWRRGATIVGLNFRLPPADLAAMTAAIGIRHTLVDTRLADLGESLVTSGSTTFDAAARWPFADAAPVDPWPIDDEAEAMIYFTSGSTGRPKAVPLTHRAVTATIPYADVHHFAPTSRSLVIPPNFHAAGATWANFGLHIGYTLIYSGDSSPSGIVTAISEQAVTHTILVPTLIHSLVGELTQNPRELPSLQHIGYGASPITQHLLRAALELLDCEFCQVYGLSESGGGVSFLRAEEHVGDAPAHLTSAGRPGEGIDMEVRGPDGTVCGIGESGELWFRAPSLTTGYLDDPTASARVLVDGWLNTRDVGFVDDEGYIHIQGRSDDMIQTGGENVHPQSVEEVLVAMPGVAECAVFGTPDPHWGQRVTAAVVVEDGDPLEIEAVTQWCAARLAGYQVPRRIVFLDTLPRTASGKVKRAALAQSVGSSSSGSTSP